MASFAYTRSQIDGIELTARVDRLLYNRSAERPHARLGGWTGSRCAAVESNPGAACRHGSAGTRAASNERN